MSLSERLAYSFIWRYRIQSRHDRIGPVYFPPNQSSAQGVIWAYHNRVIAVRIQGNSLSVLYLADNGIRTKPVFSRLTALLVKINEGRLTRWAKNWILTLKDGTEEPWAGKKLFWNDESAEKELMVSISEYLRRMFLRYSDRATLADTKLEYTGFFNALMERIRRTSNPLPVSLSPADPATDDDDDDDEFEEES